MGALGDISLGDSAHVLSPALSGAVSLLGPGWE